MKLRISVTPKKFTPAFPMRTSRGIVGQKTSYFLFLESDGAIGVGEGAPLPGLSLDGDVEWNRFQEWLETDRDLPPLVEKAPLAWALAVATQAGVRRAASIRFALETAALSILSGQPEIYFPSDFSRGSVGLQINGLVWMDGLEAMRRQAEEKVKAGFETIKFKIGTQDWEAERAMLQHFRRSHSADEITIRVDANGAYPEDQAMRVMDDLRKLDVHSIEQPIKAGQHTRMARLVKDGAIPIGLDEDLISPMPEDEVLGMIDFINPPFLVLKPSLIGGIATSKKLIDNADRRKKGWWLTSSLESPIALTALAQFAAKYPNPLPHGLSTGKIFQELVQHPNRLSGQQLFFDPDTRFDLNALSTPDPDPED